MHFCDAVQGQDWCVSVHVCWDKYVITVTVDAREEKWDKEQTTTIE